MAAASVPVPPPLDALLAAALDAAAARLERDVHFFPFLFELRPSGLVQAVALLDREGAPDVDTALGRYAAIMRERLAAGEALASAIVVHEGDAIIVRLRAADEGFEVAVPCRVRFEGRFKRRRRVALGAPVARAAAGDRGG